MSNWKNCNIADLRNEGHCYVVSAMHDVNNYIGTFRLPVTIDEFLNGWTCINYHDFCKLNPSDIVYDSDGRRYRIVDYPYERDEEGFLDIEAEELYENGNVIPGSNTVFSSSDLYHEPFVHTDYSYRERKEFVRWQPTLITKTNQPLS